MRILFISQHFPPDASANARRVSDYSRGLAKRGNKVTVISPKPSFPFGTKFNSDHVEKVIGDDDFRLIRITTYRPKKSKPPVMSESLYYLSFPIFAYLRSLLYIRKTDAIITSCPPLFVGLVGYVTKRISKRKWIIDFRDPWLDAAMRLGYVRPQSFIYRISKRLERIMLRDADMVLTVSEPLKNHIASEHDLDLDKIVLLPNGSFVPELDPSKERSNIGIFAGNLGKAFDFDMMIDAVKDLSADTDFKMVIIGGGLYEDYLRKRIAEEGLEDRMEMTGAMPHEYVCERLTGAKLTIIPIIDNPIFDLGVSAKAIESLAFGVPYISTGGKECRRFTQESGGGVNVDHDAKDMARAIERLMANENDRMALVVKGFEYVDNNFNKEKLLDELDLTIKGLCTQGR